MGFFDYDSSTGYDANGDGHVDVFDDVYMQNLIETGDGYLSEEDARRMEDDGDLDPMFMDADEIREAIEAGELDPDDVDWNTVDMSEFMSSYTQHISRNGGYSRKSSDSSVYNNTVVKSNNTNSSYSKPSNYSNYSSKSEVSNVEAIIYAVLGLVLQCVFYVMFDIDVENVPLIVMIILWILFSCLSFAVGQKLKR